MPDDPSTAGPHLELPLERERELVSHAASGQQQAMGLLYDAYLPRVYRYCMARVGNRADAEDLAEEVFLKVIGAIERFEWRPLGGSGRSPFAAWLFRIAHNHVASHYRRAATRGTPVELSEDIRDERRSPLELVETKLTIAEVFDAVQELPDAQREVVLLRFGAGLTVAETAEVLGKQQTNVKVLQHKGVQRLKRMLLEPPETAEAVQEPAPIERARRMR